jgi:carbonic anhydrase/acetyltransferase-like protein (isoleucine patch superfamily)
MEENLATRVDQLDPSAYVAEGAVVLGDVTLEAKSSVWFNAVLRGDCAPIRIGARSNVQDCCVVHADYGFPCRVGEGVTIGHGAIVHGATLEDNVLIGMNAVVQNGTVVGANSIVGVGAVVKQGMQIPAGSLVIGVPGKSRRRTTEQEIELNRLAAAHYVESARAYAGQGIGLLGEDVPEEMADDFSGEMSMEELGEAFGQLMGGEPDDDVVEIEPSAGARSAMDLFGHLFDPGGENVDFEGIGFNELAEALSQSLQGMHRQRRILLSSCRSHGLKPRQFRNRGHNR